MNLAPVEVEKNIKNVVPSVATTSTSNHQTSNQPRTTDLRSSLLETLSQQDFLRSFFSIGGLALFFSFGLLFPFRKSPQLKSKRRWLTNLSFIFGNALLIKIVIPINLLQISHAGFFEDFKILDLTGFSFTAHFFITLISLDLTIYWQHRFTHWLPPLWRLHRVHHTDIEFDTTTAGRFHPIEIIFSFLIKALVIVLFDLQASGILAFEIILNFSALFNHSNFHFSQRVDRLLKLFIITPNMHRIHHSIHPEETNSNYGFSISLWDRIFGSYSAKSKDPQNNMTIGLETFRSQKEQNIVSLLKQPFCKKEASYDHT